MGVATHLGAWRLGTQKDGSTANLGATTVAQIILDADNSPNNFYLPAGYAILRVYTYFTTATIDAAATVTWTINGTAFTTAALGAGNRRVDLSLTGVTVPQIGVLFDTTNGTGSIPCQVVTTSAVGPQQTTNVIEYVVRGSGGVIANNP